MRIVRSHLRLAAIAVGALLASQTPTLASDKGKALYVKHGCWQCHGFLGQGGGAGPKIAPDPMPLEAMKSFVRNTNRRMPPYREAVLPDADFNEIHAYLASIPKPPDPKTIPLLNP